VRLIAQVLHVLAVYGHSVFKEPCIRLRPAPCYLPVSLAGPEPSGLNYTIKQASKNVNPQNKIFLNSRNPQYTGDKTTPPLPCEKESKLFSKKTIKTGIMPVRLTATGDRGGANRIME